MGPCTGTRPGAQHAKIPAGATGGHQLLGQIVPAAVGRQLVAGLARLADLEQGLAPGPDVANAHVAFQDAGGGQVLTEGGRAEVLAKLQRPFPNVLAGVGVDGLVRPAMDVQVGLAVAFEVQAVEVQALDGDGPLADRAGDGPATIGADDAGLANVDGNEGYLLHQGKANAG